MENSYEKGKVFAVAGVTLLAAGLLAACSSSNTSKASSGEDKNYGYVYTTDPTTLDYTVSSKSATQDLTTNISRRFDGKTSMEILCHHLRKIGLFQKTV